MLKSKIFYQVMVLVLICLLAGPGNSQNNLSKTVFVFSKADLEAIYFSDNRGVKLDFSIIGIKDKEDVKVFEKNSTISKLKIKNILAEKTNVSAVFKKNVDDFRNVLIQNQIEHIIVNDIKISTANIITQEKATVLAQQIIDVPAMQFQATYNTPDNLGHFEFQVYYFETKLFTAMQNYYISLLDGSIDKLQERLKNAKEEKEDFIQQHSK